MSRKKKLGLILFGGLLYFYLLTYGMLYYRGRQEAEKVGLEGFLYVPVASVKTPDGMRPHHRRVIAYAPLNWIHVHVFGGSAPVDCLFFGVQEDAENVAGNDGSH